MTCATVRRREPQLNQDKKATKPSNIFRTIAYMFQYICHSRRFGEDKHDRIT